MCALYGSNLLHSLIKNLTCLLSNEKRKSIGENKSTFFFGQEGLILSFAGDAQLFYLTMVFFSPSLLNYRQLQCRPVSDQFCAGVDYFHPIQINTCDFADRCYHLHWISPFRYVNTLWLVAHPI